MGEWERQSSAGEPPAYGVPRQLAIDYLPLSVKAVCTQDGDLPPFLGSALRGAFGHALRAAGCIEGCTSSAHVSGCEYAPVFEPVPHPDSLFRAQRAVAPAFVFAPPPEGPIQWRRGDVLRFDWVLLAPAIARYGIVIEALENALRTGLGMQRPARFVLDTVHALADGGCWCLYARTEGGIHARTAVPVSRLVVAPGPLADGRIELAFTTPLHLRSKGQVLRRLTFRDVAKALLMRVEALAAFGQPQGQRDGRSLLALADRIQTASDTTRLTQRRRYSNRQERGFDFYGLTGACTFEGPVGAFLPMLRMAEIVHLGHGTAWGMGRLSWRTLPAP